MNIFKPDENIIENQPIIQYHEFKCFHCGFGNRFVKHDEFIDWKKELEISRKIHNSMIHEINDAMQFSELHYSMNPFKDRLIETLTKIRDKYSNDKEV